MTTTHVDASRQPAWAGFVDYYVSWSRGDFEFGWMRADTRGASYPAGPLWNYLREPPRSLANPRRQGDRVNWQFGGFGVLRRGTRNNVFDSSIVEFSAPLWLFLTAALPPVLWLRRRQRQRSRGFPMEPSPASVPAG